MNNRLMGLTKGQLLVPRHVVALPPSGGGGTTKIGASIHAALPRRRPHLLRRLVGGIFGRIESLAALLVLLICCRCRHGTVHPAITTDGGILELLVLLL